MTRKNLVPAFQITLALPPGINTQYATVNGRRVLSESARKWKKQVGRQIEQLVEKEIISEQDLEVLSRCHLSVFLEFFFTSPHRRDLDGGLKITLDALCEALNLNDNRVVDIHLTKKIDPLHPRLEVLFEGVKDWQFDINYEVYIPQKED